MVKATIAFTLALVLLAACDTQSNSGQALIGNVGRFVHVGSPIERSVSDLSSAGFHCGRNYEITPGDLLCERNRSYEIMATCIQRVIIFYDASKKRVARIEIPSIPCASF